MWYIIGIIIVAALVALGIAVNRSYASSSTKSDSTKSATANLPSLKFHGSAAGDVEELSAVEALLYGFAFAAVKHRFFGVFNEKGQLLRRLTRAYWVKPQPVPEDTDNSGPFNNNSVAVTIDPYTVHTIDDR